MSIILGASNLGIGALMIVLTIPLKRGLIKMNWWYGFRFLASYSSEENWYKINRYGAQRFVIWGIVLCGIGLITFLVSFGDDLWLIGLFSSWPLIMLIPTYECYVYAKKVVQEK